MEMRLVKGMEEKNVGVTVKTTVTNLNITMECDGKKIVSSFKKGMDFQKALGKSKELARKYFFNED